MTLSSRILPLVAAALVLGVGTAAAEGGKSAELCTRCLAWLSRAMAVSRRTGTPSRHVEPHRPSREPSAAGLLCSAF